MEIYGFFLPPEDDNEDGEGSVEFEPEPDIESDYQQIEGPIPTAVPCHFCRAFHMFAGVEHDCPCHRGEMTFCIPKVEMNLDAYPEEFMKNNPTHRYMSATLEFTMDSLPARNGFELNAILSYS